MEKRRKRSHFYRLDETELDGWEEETPRRNPSHSNPAAHSLNQLRQEPSHQDSMESSGEKEAGAQKTPMSLSKEELLRQAKETVKAEAKAALEKKMRELELNETLAVDITINLDASNGRKSHSSENQTPSHLAAKFPRLSLNGGDTASFSVNCGGEEEEGKEQEDLDGSADDKEEEEEEEEEEDWNHRVAEEKDKNDSMTPGEISIVAQAANNRRLSLSGMADTTRLFAQELNKTHRASSPLTREEGAKTPPSIPPIAQRKRPEEQPSVILEDSPEPPPTKPPNLSAIAEGSEEEAKEAMSDAVTEAVTETVTEAATDAVTEAVTETDVSMVAPVKAIFSRFKDVDLAESLPRMPLPPPVKLDELGGLQPSPRHHHRCICRRPKGLIVCGDCGLAFPGRKYSQCPVHPKDLVLSDYAACNSQTCRSTNIEEEKFSANLATGRNFEPKGK